MPRTMAGASMSGTTVMSGAASSARSRRDPAARCRSAAPPRTRAMRRSAFAGSLTTAPAEGRKLWSSSVSGSSCQALTSPTTT